MGNVAGNFFLKILRVSSYYTHLPQTCILHVMMGNVAGDLNVAGDFNFQRCVSFLFVHSPCLNMEDTRVYTRRTRVIWV